MTSREDINCKPQKAENNWTHGFFHVYVGHDNLEKVRK